MKVTVKRFSKDHEFGCLMVDIDNPIQSYIQSLINPDDLYKPEDPTQGLETRPHITIAYGFENNQYPMDVLHSGILYEPNADGHEIIPKIILKDISMFDNPDCDILMFNVESPEIMEIETKVRGMSPLPDNDKEYHPHSTIAYLKKGTAAKYVDQFKLIKGLVVTPKQLAFSNAGEENDYVHVYEVYQS